MKFFLSTILIFSFVSTGYSKKTDFQKQLKYTSDSVLATLLISSPKDKAILIIQEFGKRKSKESLDFLMQQLLLGYPPQITIHMIKALGNRKDSKAFTTLSFYTEHRNPLLRVEALKSLCKLKIDPIKNKKIYEKTNKILINALKDFNMAVREQAAWLIGKRKVKNAENTLLALFKKRSKSAILSLGFIGGLKSAKSLAIALESKSARTDLIINAIGTMLSRKDFGPEPVRIQLVKVIGKINSPAAQNTLMVYNSTGPIQFKRSRKLAYKILENK